VSYARNGRRQTKGSNAKSVMQPSRFQARKMQRKLKEIGGFENERN
jgi:hypothetical protein